MVSVLEWARGALVPNRVGEAKVSIGRTSPNPRGPKTVRRGKGGVGGKRDMVGKVVAGGRGWPSMASNRRWLATLEGRATMEERKENICSDYHRLETLTLTRVERYINKGVRWTKAQYNRGLTPKQHTHPVHSNTEVYHASLRGCLGTKFFAVLEQNCSF